jgi:hypothetical protein
MKYFCRLKEPVAGFFLGKRKTLTNCTFNTFEPIDLPFDLALAPGQGARSINGRVILLHALGETCEFGDMAAFGCSDPVLQCMCPAFFEHVQEVLTELIRCGQLLDFPDTSARGAVADEQ